MFKEPISLDTYLYRRIIGNLGDNGDFQVFSKFQFRHDVHAFVPDGLLRGPDTHHGSQDLPFAPPLHQQLQDATGRGQVQPGEALGRRRLRDGLQHEQG